MYQLVEVARVVTMLVIVALGATCFGQWRTRRAQPTRWATLAFGVLAIVAILRGVTPETGGEIDEWERRVTFFILLAFPYCFYRFSAAFEGRSVRLERRIVYATSLLVVATFLLPYIAAVEQRPPWFQAYLLCLLGLWTMAPLLNTASLWRAGRGQSDVVRGRLRLLSSGVVGVSFALVVGTAAETGSPAAELAVQGLGLAGALLIFAGVAPPKLLLASWRNREQSKLQQATRTLVGATSYEELEKLLPHVVDVVGGCGAALVARDGKPIAESGIEPGVAAQTGRDLVEGVSPSGIGHAGRVELPLASGWLVVWVGPYTPFFGSQELDLLGSVGTLFDVALERIRLAGSELQTRGALRRQREFAESLLRSSSDGMLAFDHDFRYTLWNPAMEKITGVPASETLGESAFETFPYLSEIGEQVLFQQALAGEYITLAERYLDVAQTGVHRWFEITYSPLYGDRDEVIGGLSVVRDVTARKEAEELRAHMAAIVDSSEDAIYSRALDGTVMSWNAAAERLYGYSAKEMIGAASSVLVPPDRSDEVGTILERIERGERIDGFETSRVRKDGTHVLVSLTDSPIRNGVGEIVSASTIARDITEKVRAEENLVAAKDEAERANAAKSEFLSRMSHELRTPLNAILGFAQLLEMEEPPPEQRESIDHVLRAGRHLLGLVNEVLDISGLETGKVALRLEPVDVGEIITEVVSLNRLLAAEWEVKLAEEGVQESDLWVNADRQRVVHVLLNLVSNAIKYNRPNGSVTVSCEKVDEHNVSITVSDTGRGMTPEDIQRAFDPFDRVGAEELELKVEGSGLGLTLSKRLAEAMGGSLEARSTPGRGSSFWLTLPSTTRPADENEERSAAAASGRQRQVQKAAGTVLYVEDNLANAYLVQHVLAKREGVRLLEAMQGSVGRDLARQHHPDLILLDLDLPDISGWEVLSLLRRDEGTKDIPVVVVSADSSKEQIGKLLDAGAHAYLTKPIDVSELLTLVDRALNHRESSVDEPVSRSARGDHLAASGPRTSLSLRARPSKEEAQRPS